MSQLYLRSVRIHPSGPVDVRVDDGRIVEVAPASPEMSAADPASDSIVDGAGRLLLPTLVDGHCHPDKTTWGEPWVSRAPADSLAGLIDNDVALQTRSATPVRDRAARLFERYVAHGARAIRAHVDVAPVYGLGNVIGVAEAAASIAPALHVEIVAFPQLGVMRTPGTAELLREAVGAGATVIGGIDPGGLDGDLHGQLDVVFGLARETGLGIDIHLHDRGELGRTELAEIIRRTRVDGLAGRVTLGHAMCFADYTGTELDDLAGETADAGISVATCAHGEDPMIPVERLRVAGVRVVLGSDGVRDAWTPFGNADMIDRTHLLAYRTGAETDDALEACLEVAAHAGADLLGLERSTLSVGDPADFMLVDAEVPAQVVVDRPVPHVVVHRGRIVARQGITIAD